MRAPDMPSSASSSTGGADLKTESRPDTVWRIEPRTDGLPARNVSLRSSLSSSATAPAICDDFRSSTWLSISASSLKTPLALASSSTSFDWPLSIRILVEAV